MCWHVRERVSLWEINKGGTADFESVLYLKGQIFLLLTSVWRARSRAEKTARYAGGLQPALQNHPPVGY